MRTIDKSPGAVLDYGHRWTRWLDGDTIASSTFIVPTGLSSVQKSHTATTTTVWLAGGDVGKSYNVINRISTAAGRIDERTIVVRVVQR